MPGVSILQTAEVQLSPKLLTELRAKLTKYSELRDKITDAKDEQDKIKTDIEKLFAKADQYEALAAGCRIATDDGDFPLKIVAGTQKKVNWKYIYSQGWMSAAQKDEATKEVPKKAYLKVSCPGEREEKAEDE